MPLLSALWCSCFRSIMWTAVIQLTAVFKIFFTSQRNSNSSNKENTGCTADGMRAERCPAFLFIVITRKTQVVCLKHTLTCTHRHTHTYPRCEEECTVTLTNTHTNAYTHAHTHSLLLFSTTRVTSANKWIVNKPLCSLNQSTISFFELIIFSLNTTCHVC